MEYCCNNEDFYKEMLSSYLTTNKYQELNDKYKEEDWENYRILVHALKSTSLSIGAVKVSEKAKMLEAAAKEGNIDYNNVREMALEHKPKLIICGASNYSKVIDLC